MPNYTSFQNFLKNNTSNKISLTISEIERIIGGSLPFSAYKYPAWWSNSPTHPLMKKVLGIGWRSGNLNLKDKTISFSKDLIPNEKNIMINNNTKPIPTSKTNSTNHSNIEKICVVTACGNKKEDVPLPAWRIYKSPRIKAVYRRKGGEDMYILSAEHGLLPAEKIIKPYNRLLDPDRIQKLLPKIESTIKKYDKIIYFRAGARKLYEQCLEIACKNTGVRLESFGFGFMGEINELENKISKAKRNP